MKTMLMLVCIKNGGAKILSYLLKIKDTLYISNGVPINIDLCYIFGICEKDLVSQSNPPSGRWQNEIRTMLTKVIQSNQGSTLTFETGGPPGPPEANCTRPNANLGGPVYNFIKSCINSYSTSGTINYFLCPWKWICGHVVLVLSAWVFVCL